MSASGQALPSTTSCDTASVPTSERISRSYDARNRLAALTIPGGNGSQSWTWTPDGLPASVITWNDGGNNWVTNSYSYNRRRLMTGESQVISDGHDTWSFGYGYNANGHLSSLTYPAGLTISYAPNALGQPTQAGSFATGVSYHPSGAVKQFTYGNGLVYTMTQNGRQMPDRIRSVQGSLVVHDDSMDYDHNGNVAAISDALPGQRGNRTMSYDGLDRLTATTSPMFTGGVVYGYDVLDNLKRVKAPGRDHTYHYDGSNRLHNVTNTVGGGAVIGLGYDVRGNLANKNGQAYVFDHGNRLRSATGLESYRYDAEGRRIKATTPANAAIYSVYNKSGQLLFQRDERVSFRFQYVYLGSQLIGLRRRPIGDNTETLMYYHTDVLGSNVAITDAARNVIQRSEYEPYGRVLNRATNNRPGFTGHLEDAATGLTYMQQRYYDPTLGVFLSVDPITAYRNPIGQFHRYRYANNNPYKFADPDGRESSAIRSMERDNTAYLQGKMSVGEVNANREARAIGAAAGLVGVVAGVVATKTGAVAAVTTGAVRVASAAQRGAAAAGAAAESASLSTGLAAQRTANVVVNGANAANAGTTNAAVRVMSAVESEASMIMTAAGASPRVSSSIASQVSSPGFAAEVATGAISGAANVPSPASSVANFASAEAVSALRKEIEN